MTANLLDGKQLAASLEKGIRLEIEALAKKYRRVPQLTAVMVGEHEPSKLYIKHKMKACERVGMRSQLRQLPQDLSLKALETEIHSLNQDRDVDGILIQLPLPGHIPLAPLFEMMNPDKDVDGLHPLNLGRLAQKNPFLRPCTPYGIMQLINSTGIALRGLQATVIGVSTLVGRPMMLELLMAGCTVTACHSATQDLETAVRQADILVIAVGKPHFLPGNWVKPGALVIDVGINRLPGPDSTTFGQLVGDLDFETARTRAAWISPVPGGVGPMTITALLQNTLTAYLHRQNPLKLSK